MDPSYSPLDFSLTQKRVLVTASSQGIGNEIVGEFLRCGAHVMINGRSRKRLVAVAKALRRKFSKTALEVFPGDCTLAKTISTLPVVIEKTWGALDILILNLGSGRSVAGFDADEKEWQRVLTLNLTSAAASLRECIPLLEKGNQPSVVLIGSIAGLEALGAPLAYGAAKAGLEHFMRSSSRLLAAKGIRINMVSPGNIFSIGGTWDKKLKESPSKVKAMLDLEVPMKRLGTPKEVAAATIFLASPLASFITGANLRVDGGQCRGQ